MQTVRQLPELRETLAGGRAAGGRVALVPTMGALHSGHRALVELARVHAEIVVVSIFVNPHQFGEGEDFERYPRNFVADATMLEAAGCDVLWMPDTATVYPSGFVTKLSVLGLSEPLEGAARPGHFDGVATIVAKLLNQVTPDFAIFGEKDFQQLAVVRRLVTDLDFTTEIIGAPIVRDGDGLALSSRNAYLSDAARARAVALPLALFRAAAELGLGAGLEATLDRARADIQAAGFDTIDYVALVDAETLRPAKSATAALRLLAAATIEGTRLIDNIAIESTI